MGWLRLDDGFAQHPKVAALSDRDYRAWTRVLLYCARYRTQGDVPDHAFREIGVAAQTRRKFIAVGLLDMDEEGIASVHDWADFNPPDPTNAERQKRWRERQKDAGSNDDRNAKRNASDRYSGVTVTQPRVQAGARDPSPKEELKAVVPRETPPTELPFEKELTVTRILNAIGDHADEGTDGVVRSYAHRLPLFSLEKVLESTGIQRPINRAGYVVNAMKDELAQNEREGERSTA